MYSGRLRSRLAKRKGITLLELLVAMTLILVLASLTVLFMPNISEQARAARGGVMLQGWLNDAKQRALRDQGPRGLRLFIDSDSMVGSRIIVKKFQYVEQPDDYVVGQIQTMGYGTPTPDTTKVVLSVSLNVDADPNNWAVQTGDYLEVLGGGTVHRIIVDPSNGNLIALQSPLPYAIGPTSSFRIIRSPRPTGDELLELPDQVGVDITQNVTYTRQPGDFTLPGYFDVLFAPSGEVITSGVTRATLDFWVRDYNSSTDPLAGDPTILAVYVRSGAVAAHPPATMPAAPPPNWTPYAYVEDGRSSGR